MYTFSIFLVLITLYATFHYRTVNLKVDTLSFDKSLSSRGMLALFVMLHHLGVEVITPPLNVLTEPLGVVSVGVFFLMSGYGLEYSYRKKDDGYLHSFIQKRVFKLLLPFLVAVVLWNVEECFLYPNESLLNRWMQIRDGDTNGILPYCWYVMAAMFFYVVFWLSYRFLKSKLNVLAIGVFWLIWCVIWKLNQAGWWYGTSHMFLIGILYCKFENLITRCNAYVWMIASLFGTVIASTVDNFYFGMLSCSFFSLLLVCGITLCEFHSKVLDFIGKISYEMYLVQALPIFALKDSGLPIAIIVVLSICIDIVLAYMLHLLLNKIERRVA